MSKRPLNFAVLKYMTTVDVACVDDVMAALEDEYSDRKMFKPSGILEVLIDIRIEKNDLLVEDHYEYHKNGELMIYYRAPEEGEQRSILTFNSFRFGFLWSQKITSFMESRKHSPSFGFPTIFCNIENEFLVCESKRKWGLYYEFSRTIKGFI